MKTYEVKLSLSHGGNEYRRGGFLFTANKVVQYVPVPVIIPENQMTPELLNDQYLEIAVLPEGA